MHFYVRTQTLDWLGARSQTIVGGTKEGSIVLLEKGADGVFKRGRRFQPSSAMAGKSYLFHNCVVKGTLANRKESG